ncbi:hypothetical protein M5585_04450 [Serratia ureilytica]
MANGFGVAVAYTRPLAITATMDSHWPSFPLQNRYRHSVLFWLSRVPAATRPGQCAAGTGNAVVW